MQYDPPGSSSDALCETIITWTNNGKFKTRGLDSDQTVAAIIATQKMLNVIPTPTLSEEQSELTEVRP
jgi:D-citramalate synthase